MASFADLVSDVKIMTNRPDLDNEIKLAVKAATLKAHQSDFYPKDLFETAIQWTPIDYFQSLDYRTLVPRWRSLKYIRKYDPTNTTTPSGKIFTIAQPENILDQYQLNRDDICYLAGASIEIRSSTQDAYMLLGCYIFPDITEATYDSWIALDHPYAIEFEAASKIFKTTGDDAQSTQMSQEVAVQYALLQRDSIIAQGY